MSEIISTYSGDPSTSLRDECRFLIGDTQDDEWMLSDVEIDYLITKHEGKNSIYATAAAACDAIVSKLAREIDIVSDAQSLALGQLMDRYKTLAADLREQAAEDLGGASNLFWGASGYPPSFGLRQWDDPAAGNQDFGDIDDYRLRNSLGVWDQRMSG